LPEACFKLLYPLSRFSATFDTAFLLDISRRADTAITLAFCERVDLYSLQGHRVSGQDGLRKINEARCRADECDGSSVRQRPNENV